MEQFTYQQVRTRVESVLVLLGKMAQASVSAVSRTWVLELAVVKVQASKLVVASAKAS